MQNMVLRDTQALAIANVDKIYTQWQRSGKAKDILKQLLHPQKREVAALDQLTLSVEYGQFLAYAGANGAGKSTTIKILSGILHPTRGTVRVLGMDPVKDRIRLMEKIGVLFGQRTELWWDHPVITSYEWKKSVWNIPDRVYNENLELVTELLDLSDLLKTFGRELSLGQRMRADLGMLLLHSPEMIFLDEPTLGLDVLAKRRMIDFLKTLNKEKKTTIVVTSHDMDDLEEMARRIVLLHKGKIAFDGDFDQVRKVQGSLSKIQIRRKGSAPALTGLAFCGCRDGVYEYEFNREVIPIHEILGQLAAFSDIADVEIKKAPIEEVIAKLYTSWKA